MRGDALASGKQRGASFQTGVRAGVEADLKLMYPLDFCERYGINMDTYHHVSDAYQSSGIIPNLAPTDYAKIEDVKPFDESKTFFENMQANVTVPPQIQYRAKAFGENIIVQRVEKGHSSNIIIPDNALAKSDNGYVISVGDRVQNLKPGQLVMFDQFAAHGNEMKLVDDEGIERENLLLKECDVLCLLEKVQSSD